MSKMVEVECDQCGKTTNQPPYKIKKSKHHFCDRECHSKYQDKKIIVKCEYCGKTIKKRPCDIKNSNHHFCSQECDQKYRITTQIEVKCEWCEKTIKIQPCKMKRLYHFCNHKCRGKWDSKNRTNENANSWKGGGIEVDCDFCGKKIKKYLYWIKHHKHHFCNNKCRGKWFSQFLSGENSPNWIRAGVKCDCCGKIVKKIPANIKGYKHHFCNKKCRGEFFKGENNPCWCDGRSNEPYPLYFDDNLKEQIRRRDHYVCQECGDKSNGRKLDVHHIDYDKFNSVPSNLITLCNPCNLKANYNRDDWSKYYQEKIAEIEQRGVIE